MSDRPGNTSVPVERAAGLVAVVGLWVFWSGVFLTGAGWIVTINVLLGAAIVTFGAYAAAWPTSGPVPVPTIVALAVTLFLGLVVVAAPFLLVVTYDILFWSNVVSGALVAVLSAVGSVGSWQLTRSTNRAGSAQ